MVSPDRARARDPARNRRRGVSQRATHEIEVDAGYTGVWRRETLLRHGGWDQDWPINEDGELAARIREAGGRIVCIPEMAALYVPRDSLRALARQYWRYGNYRAKTCHAHPESMRRSHLLPPALALTLVPALLPKAPARPAGASGTGGLRRARCLRPRPRGFGAGIRDACSLPVVLATMHLSWGFGFLVGRGPLRSRRSARSSCWPAGARAEPSGAA